VVFVPEATFVHLGGASTRTAWPEMYREQLRSHVRFLAHHRGLRHARLARALLIVAMNVRSVVFRGERGRLSRESARWLRETSLEALLATTRPERRPDVDLKPLVGR
jgi:GT2 family glycosyltransferase